MILYIIYNADLLDVPGNEENEDSAGFVDDVALVAIGADFEDTTNRLGRMMSKEDGGLQWSREHNSRFEVNKSAVLHATRRTQPDPANDRKRIPLDRPPLMIQGQQVKEVANFKYLGVQIDSQLRWKEQAQRATANATKWLLQFRRLTRPSTGVSSKLMRQLYISVALPKIMYGADVWYSPPSKPVGYTKNTGSVGVLKSLQKLQRIATLAITGGLRSTPTDLLDAHAGILPIELAMKKMCHRAAVRLLSLPKNHPLYRMLGEARARPPTSHPSPIDDMLQIFRLRRKTIEMISPRTDDPYALARFRTKIEESRGLSIEEEKRDEPDYKIFTDGSDHDGGVGAGAVMYKKGSPAQISQLKAYLGSLKEHDSYEAEVVGGILAMWMIANTADAFRKTVIVYSDNQPFIKTVTNPKAVPGQYLLKHLNKAANELRAKLEIKWISGHSEVRGNERADKLAKEAAEGRASRRDDLPPILRGTLLISASSKNREHLAHLRRKWGRSWQDSPRRRRLERIDDTFPFDGYRKRQDKLSRAHASHLLQVRSGHLPLNVYLHRIKKSETKKCQACAIEPGDDTPDETVSHFLNDCDAYTPQRQSLIRAVGSADLRIKDIMLKTEHMKALAKYITRTKRFEQER